MGLIHLHMLLRFCVQEIWGFWIARSLCHRLCWLRCMPVCMRVKNFLYRNTMLHYQRRVSFVFSGFQFWRVRVLMATLHWQMWSRCLSARGLGILDSIHIVSWPVSIVLHTNLHASQEFLVPEHDAVLPKVVVAPPKFHIKILWWVRCLLAWTRSCVHAGLANHVLSIVSMCFENRLFNCVFDSLFNGVIVFVFKFVNNLFSDLLVTFLLSNFSGPAIEAPWTFKSSWEA